MNQGLFYDGSYWVNKTIASALGYTPANQATTLTINGQAYDLSANRTWSVGTVTSVDVSVPTGFAIAGNPVTTAGTLALTFASGYSLPTNASQTNWDTAYTNRITSLTTTGTSGVATLISNVLNIPQYQAQGNYITSLTGEATGSGPGATSVTLVNSAVTGKVLTGLTVAGSSISATDSILTAFGKLQGQVNDLVGGLQYQGTWNASTNTPTITSGVGTDGHFYIVSVAGNTTIDGISGWEIGDWIVFHGSAWQKVDNTESVVSVNGFTGAVTLTTTNISEGTNLYFTNARARTAISLTTTGNSGASTYNNGTGVLNVPQYTLAGLGGVPTTRSLTINGTAFDLSADRSWSVGTVTSIATSGPITGGTITGTGTIGITQAGSATDGYLSSIDWNTFNNKQATISLTTTGNSGASTFLANVLNVPTYTLSGLGGVPTTRTITINGVGFDLSADRSYSVGTTTGTGTAGQVAFWDGSTSQTGDNGLFWDNTNKRLGVGTIAPDSRIHAFVSSGSIQTLLKLENGSATASSGTKISFTEGGAERAAIISQINTGTTPYLSFENNGAERWRITSTGILQSNGAQTIQTSTGNLTLATAAGNGNILLSPNGTGNVGVGNNSPDVKLVVSDSANLLQMRIGSLTAGISPLIRIQGRNTANTTNRYADIKLDADLGIFTLMAPGTSAPLVNALNIFTGGSIGINTTTEVTSSIFTMASTTKGFLPPRMTSAQRTAIASPAEGLIVYQTDSVIGLYIYANATWRTLGMI